MICFIITGLPATGKTFYSEKILEHLIKREIKCYHIFGDAVAHIAYNCTYTTEQLNLKYDNMVTLIENAYKYKYDVVIIDDIFKRYCDFTKIRKFFSCLHIIYLEAMTSDLLHRNSLRPKYHQLDANKLLSYIANYSDIIPNNCKDLCINVSKFSKRKCIKLLLQYIDQSIKEG